LIAATQDPPGYTCGEKETKCGNGGQGVCHKMCIAQGFVRGGDCVKEDICCCRNNVKT